MDDMIDSAPEENNNNNRPIIFFVFLPNESGRVSLIVDRPSPKIHGPPLRL